MFSCVMLAPFIVRATRSDGRIAGGNVKNRTMKRTIASVLTAGAIISGISLVSAGTASADTRYVFSSQSSCNSNRDAAVRRAAATAKPRGQFQGSGTTVTPCKFQYGKWTFSTIRWM